MTYKQIIKALNDLKCASTAAALDYATREEACKLIDGGSSWGSYKNQQLQRLRIPSDEAMEAACEFYAEDISEQLANPQPLTPEVVLNHRRMPTAWAVAEVLKREIP